MFMWPAGESNMVCVKGSFHLVDKRWRKEVSNWSFKQHACSPHFFSSGLLLTHIEAQSRSEDCNLSIHEIILQPQGLREEVFLCLYRWNMQHHTTEPLTEITLDTHRLSEANSGHVFVRSCPAWLLSSLWFGLMILLNTVYSRPVYHTNSHVLCIVYTETRVVDILPILVMVLMKQMVHVFPIPEWGAKLCSGWQWVRENSGEKPVLFQATLIVLFFLFPGAIH